MHFLGLMITRASAPPTEPVQSTSFGNWFGRYYPIVREPFTGAWQQNQEIRTDVLAGYFPVYACVTLIASDIAKCCLDLVTQDEDGVWTVTSNPAFSPVLKRPNHYQLIGPFIEQWILSKLLWGNAYVLKQRDRRGVISALYVLNPSRVRVLVAADGSIYYELRRDNLSELTDELVTVPASEIIHDPYVPLFHPLIGVTPIAAASLSASQGLAMQTASINFFKNGGQPGGVIQVPGAISDKTAQDIESYWQTNFSGDKAGKVAILSGGMKYDPVSAVNASDAQLIDQMKWSAENICSVFHVPAYMIQVGAPPPYANFEPLVQLYYAQCLQSLMTNLERHLDDGLGLVNPINGVQYGTAFDVDDLIWMDTATRGEAASKSSGILSPNEARRKYYGMPAVTGGDSPMTQQQNFSLEALAERDANNPFSKSAPAAPADSATMARAVSLQLVKSARRAIRKRLVA